VLEVGYLSTLGIKLEQNVQPNNANPGLARPIRAALPGRTVCAGYAVPSYITIVGNSVPVAR